MTSRFEPLFRGFCVLLVIIVSWSLWAEAQNATNKAAPSAASTNQPPALVRSVEKMQGEYLTFGLDRVEPLRQFKFLGEPLWKYLASLIYILLAFYISKLIDFMTYFWLKKLTAKHTEDLMEFLLELLRGPIKVVALVIFLNLGLNIFNWSEVAKVWLSKALILTVAASLTYLAVKVVYLLLDIWRRRSAHEDNRKFNDQLFMIIRRSSGAFIVIVSVLVTASNIGINITAAITSLSIGGLAVGLAAQDTLANLFGAVAVFADKPFRIGDYIKMSEAEGRVETIGLRSTRVRNPEGHLIAVPNKTMGNAAITNITQRATIKTTMNFTFPRTLPTDKIKRALALLEEVYRSNPMTQDVWISFNQFTGSNINIMVVHWWKETDYQKYLAGMQEMNLQVKERFDAEGIPFA
jgi:MscS family membrane protein